MDENNLLFLLRGGHINMNDRIERGLWPHQPLKFSDVAICLASAIEAETWFPYEWEPTLGDAIREGGIIERQSPAKYIYHSYRHPANNQYVLTEQSKKTFNTSLDAAKYYLKWDLHLPGDLDGWKVIE
jgi:hypothetical protein